MVGEMATTPSSGSRAGNGRAVRRRMSKYSPEDKENFDIFGVNPGENQKRSPLPEGFPRKPLNDITAILQSLQDPAGEGSSKHRKPLTRSQNLGKCARNYQLVESSSLSGPEVGLAKKKSKGKSTPQATALKTKSVKGSARLAFNLEAQVQDFQDPVCISPSEQKEKLLTAEARSKTLVSKCETSTAHVACSSSGELSLVVEVEATCSDPQRADASEQVMGEREKNWSGPVAMEVRQEASLQDVGKLPSTPGIAELKEVVEKTPRADYRRKNSTETTATTRDGVQRAPGEKKTNALANRSSVAKFR
ncbi:hypothetical protein R1sor_018419 [Riccia sorocarpa]|uniref:Uncharacterized protein n=1 Tax=Riccia sorocarpa TaxID=122646 RepID=A0ABD3I9Q5_9MARC